MTSLLSDLAPAQVDTEEGVLQLVGGFNAASQEYSSAILNYYDGGDGSWTSADGLALTIARADAVAQVADGADLPECA